MPDMGRLVRTDSLHPHPKLTEIVPPLSAEEFEELTESIRTFGQKQDIVVDAESRILDGLHRWKVATALGLPTVSVFPEYSLSAAQAERLGIELNANRRHWSREYRRAAVVHLLKLDPERSDRDVGRSAGVEHHTVASVRSVLIQSGEIPHFDARKDPRTGNASQPATKPPRAPTLAKDRDKGTGKAPQYDKLGSQRAAREAKVLPISEKVERALEALPEEAREPVRSLVEEPGVPDVIGVEMVERVAAMEPEARAEVVELAKSDDERDRSLAKTKAAALPDPVDPRFNLLGKISLDLKHCIGFCDRDVDPSFRERLEALRAEVVSLRARVSRRSA